MQSRVIFLLALVLGRHFSDAFFFGFINTITGASRHREVTNRLHNIQQGIDAHRAETRRDFGIVNNKLNNIDGKLDIHHRQNQQTFREVFTAIGNLGDNIADGRREAQQNFRRTTAQIDKLQNSVDKNHREVLQNFAQSFDLFYYIGSNLNMVGTNVRDILDLVGSQRETDPHLGSEIVHLNDKIDKLSDNFAKIDKSFYNFLQYSKDVFDFNNYTLIDYAMASLSHSGDSPMTILKDIHDTFLRDGGLLTAYLKHGVGEYLVCSKVKTPQQSLFGLYEMAVFAELKALLVMSFSFDLKEYFGKGSFERERVKEVDSCIDRLNSLGDRVEATLRASMSHLWVCDSVNQNIGDSAIQFTDFIQGNIVHTRNKGPRQCDGLTSINSPGSATCNVDIFPTSHVCKGTVFGCTSQNIDSVCLAAAPRRYDSIKLSFGRKYGAGECKHNSKLSGSCGYCLCYCDGEASPEAERHISLDAAISDAANERVVTGVKFTKHFGVLHLQVQEADLGPLGMINGSTARWVPVEADLVPQKFKLTRDRNTIDIDIFEGEPGYVLTGVKFREVTHGVTLEVRLTPYHPESGDLDLSRSIWKNNMNKKSVRQKITIENVNPPTAAKVAPKVRSTTNQYIEVTTTGMEEDVAQTVVPFFDAREVTPSRLIPLSGFGLQYKSAGDRYGGYIAPVLVSLNYADNVDKNIPIPKSDAIHPAISLRGLTTSSGKCWGTSCYLSLILFIAVYILSI